MERRERFAKVMAGCGEVYGKDLTPANLELYYELLKDVPIEEVEANAYKHMRTSVFFPKPVELRTEKGAMKAMYHQLYVPPWHDEPRWLALKEGRRELNGDTKGHDADDGTRNGKGGEVK